MTKSDYVLFYPTSEGVKFEYNIDNIFAFLVVINTLLDKKSIIDMVNSISDNIVTSLASSDTDSADIKFRLNLTLQKLISKNQVMIKPSEYGENV